jgi:hypothetical protein
MIQWTVAFGIQKFKCCSSTHLDTLHSFSSHKLLTHLTVKVYSPRTRVRPPALYSVGFRFEEKNKFFGDNLLFKIGSRCAPRAQNVRALSIEILATQLFVISQPSNYITFTHRVTGTVLYCAMLWIFLFLQHKTPPSSGKCVKWCDQPSI